MASVRLRFASFVSRLFVKKWLSSVSDVPAIRRAFNRQARLQYYVPPPSDFRNGNIGNKTRKSQVKWVSRGVVTDGDLLMYIHGGGYIAGSPDTHKHIVAKIVGDLGIEAIMPRYRLAPEHPYPAGFEDIVACYHAVADSGRDPRRLILGGDSAGGGLMFALLNYLTANDLPMPLCCFAISPSVDLRDAAVNRTTNAKSEAVLAVDRFPEMRSLYLGNRDPAEPSVSPILGSFAGCPPILMHVSDREVLLDDTLAMQNKLLAQEVDVLVRNWPTSFHVFHLLLGYVPEAKHALRDIADFIRTHQKVAPTSL